MNDVRRTMAEGSLSVAMGFAGVKRREEGLAPRAWCATAGFVALGCLGNVSGFKKRFKQMCRGWAWVQLMTQLFRSCVHLLEEKNTPMFVCSYTASLCVCCRSLQETGKGSIDFLFNEVKTLLFAVLG